MLAREPESLWREKVIAVVNAVVSLLVVGGNKLSEVRSFIILLSEEGFTSFSINNLTNFFSEKKSKMKLSGVSVFFGEHSARDPRLQLGKKEGLVTCPK